MRLLLVGLVLLGFVLFDVVTIVALCNMFGWTALSWEMLVLLLGVGVVSMAVGIVALHRIEKRPRGG